jgi:hypothetical protein
VHVVGASEGEVAGAVGLESYPAKLGKGTGDLRFRLEVEPEPIELPIGSPADRVIIALEKYRSRRCCSA